jgi:hypothetical protein
MGDRPISGTTLLICHPDPRDRILLDTRESKVSYPELVKVIQHLENSQYRNFPYRWHRVVMFAILRSSRKQLSLACDNQKLLIRCAVNRSS